MEKRRNRSAARGGFTLLEIVIAMAMLALIAVPAVGIAAMAAKKNTAFLSSGLASQLRTRVEAEIRSLDPFNQDLDGAEFLVSGDLREVVYLNGEGSQGLNGDAYFRLMLTTPVGYIYNEADAYRLYICRMTWPVDPASGVDVVDQNVLLTFRK